MKLYVARDKNNSLSLYSGKPHRIGSHWFVDEPEDGREMRISMQEFPAIKWEDEPIECRLITSKNWVPAILPEGIMCPAEITCEYEEHMQLIREDYDKAVLHEKAKHAASVKAANLYYIASRNVLRNEENENTRQRHEQYLKYLQNPEDKETAINWEIVKVQYEIRRTAISDKFVAAKAKYLIDMREEDAQYEAQLQKFKEIKFAASKEAEDTKNICREAFRNYVFGRKEASNE